MAPGGAACVHDGGFKSSGRRPCDRTRVQPAWTYGTNQWLTETRLMEGVGEFMQPRELTSTLGNHGGRWMTTGMQEQRPLTTFREAAN